MKKIILLIMMGLFIATTVFARSYESLSRAERIEIYLECTDYNLGTPQDKAAKQRVKMRFGIDDATIRRILLEGLQQERDD